MVFIYPQHHHDLIPQAHASEADMSLVCEIYAFRNSMFQMFQQKVEDVKAASPVTENSNQLYLTIRHSLDTCPEVMETHRRRGVFQDRLWAQVLSSIEQDRQRLEAIYDDHQTGKGRLELNLNLEMPAHQLKAHIHRMPGGYLQAADDSFEQGILYDHGVFLYGRGWFGPLNDELGQTLVHHVLAPHYPHFQPATILDLGCSVGHSTLPYTSAFPDAQVWGVDVSASLLRYAIARARLLNHEVNFAQHSAEHTDFDDHSFDLVVSHILLHEIPNISRKRVFAESYRLLKPGGLMVHLESQLFLKPPSLVARYFRDTEVWANSEPYLGSSKFEDFPSYALEAGFASADFQVHFVPGYYASQLGKTNPGWVAFCGVKPKG